MHAQLFVPGISDEGGATTTSLVRDFDEGPVRFESVHSMSMPIDSPRSAMLRVSVFAQVTSMHLDKLLSWDDMRDSASLGNNTRKKHSRIPESEYFSEERHDVFARVQIQEISESGEYEPVEAVQTSGLDVGAFQLHQGLQRRVVLSITYSPAKNLIIRDITKLRIGRLALLDHSGKSSDLDTPSADIGLKVVSPPSTQENADGTSILTIICHWDSSVHASPLLDRSTSDKYRVQVSLSWNVLTEQLRSPLTFSMDLQLQMRSRSFVLQQSMFQQLLGSQRIVHSAVDVYAVSIQPMSAKRAADLWRMNTEAQYVKGEESLIGWTPRGVSLVQDFIRSRKQKRLVAEVETTRSVLSRQCLETPEANPNSDGSYTEDQKRLVQKALELWASNCDSGDRILSKDNLEPPQNGAAFAPSLSRISRPNLVGTVRHVPKNPSVLKSGYLLCPNEGHSRGVRRWVELRRPYLHIYSLPDGDELLAINLANSRIDHDPQLAHLLQRPGASNVWAVFAPQNSFLFRGKNERDKIEWILKMDESYFSSNSTSGSSSQDGGD
jgi:kinesin family member 1